MLDRIDPDLLQVIYFKFKIECSPQAVWGYYADINIPINTIYFRLFYNRWRKFKFLFSNSKPQIKRFRILKLHIIEIDNFYLKNFY